MPVCRDWRYRRCSGFPGDFGQLEALPLGMLPAYGGSDAHELASYRPFEPAIGIGLRIPVNAARWRAGAHRAGPARSSTPQPLGAGPGERSIVSDAAPDVLVNFLAGPQQFCPPWFQLFGLIANRLQYSTPALLFSSYVLGEVCR